MTAFGVPAAAVGHLYQVRYALLLLMRSVRELGPTVEVSLERTDDIGLDQNGALAVLVQTKHHGARAARPVSLTDSSVDLWKTLRVWSEGIETGAVRIPGTLLQLVSTAVAPPSTAASLLRPTERNVEQALRQLGSVAATSRSQENAAAYAAFNSLDAPTRRSLLEQVQILDGSPHIGDVTPLLERELITNIGPEHIPGFLTRLEGWWFDVVIVHLQSGALDRISGLDLIRYMHELQRQLRDDNLPIDELLLDEITLASEDHERRTFVQQLRLVGLRHNGVLAAVRDYYRAFAQRSRWAGDDLLYLSELDRYERRLIDEWRHAFGLMEAECPADEDGRRTAGLHLYSTLTQRHLPIRPECADGFIARGSLHMLADDQRIGWHVDFIEHLRAVLSASIEGS